MPRASEVRLSVEVQAGPNGDSKVWKRPLDNMACIGHIRHNMNAMKDLNMTHRRITPSLGRRIIDSALYNGDSVPDVILTTAQIAVESRRTTDTREVAAEFERQGRRIDRYGWLALEG